MSIAYIIFLLTFLIYPIISVIVSNFIRLNKIPKLIKPILIIYLIHNILFFLGISLRGDYADYFIFSTEYLLLCLTINLLPKATNNTIRKFRILGIVIISIGLIVGFIGIFLFSIISQDYEADKIFRFSNNDKTYETRRYSFGTVGSVNTRYTFVTYRIFNYLPIENKIDKTDFFQLNTALKISEPELRISLRTINNKRQIVFQSTNGQIFTKKLE